MDTKTVNLADVIEFIGTANRDQLALIRQAIVAERRIRTESFKIGDRVTLFDLRGIAPGSKATVRGINRTRIVIDLDEPVWRSRGLPMQKNVTVPMACATKLGE